MKKGSNISAPNEIKQLQSEQISEALRDHERRKNNLVITGLPESTNTNGEANDDRAQFLNLCETYLSMKLYIAERACTRIGKPSTDRPRRLLIRLSSETAARELLWSAKKLRHCEDSAIEKSVYINADPVSYTHLTLPTIYSV